MFVRPDELKTASTLHGLMQQDLRGMRYQPLRHLASWFPDTRVNYISSFARAEKKSVDSLAQDS
jgi:2-polyprenyl-3-methyl-5-hydroxy-6-metoxy-1,4-benzoquinol methylase